ncbi:hypothetical protein BAE44_0026445 [Dichanthelium oligosanthes]|uniref:Plant-specific domain TIGR01615 family protein n=1 Tax=Dichanthelium oligosanthes TaxID=888268 RepID=A0A1E5UI29_9POAL|nr:hypothetical protein BAE44_0026445 [Dichanthelium oligosanthes]
MVTMESLGAYKKATAALDEAARARLQGPFISGVAPSSAAPSRRADTDDDLMDLVDEFYNGYGEHGADSVAARDAVAPRTTEWEETLRLALADAAADAAAARIRAEVERIVRDAGLAVVVGGGGMRKHLVERLRARGFDAGLCRSSWERTSSVPAPGSYEYVDVTMGSSSRYVVEVNVAAEFEIARPSAEYQDLLSSLPPVLVARPEALKELAAAMCAAAAESIRGAGMHVPPWRRARYVQAKWSGQFVRVEAAAPARPEAGARAVVAHARRPGGRKNCGMEMGRREVAVGRDALASVRPLFRGL